MNRLTLISLVLAVALLSPPGAGAQETTEVYIPIGQSPGVSGVSSVIGIVSEVDYETRTLVVQSADRTTTVSMDDETDYYLDRSDSERSNTKGNMYDCTIGRTVEVKFADDGTADWVKIDAD